MLLTSLNHFKIPTQFAHSISHSKQRKQTLNNMKNIFSSLLLPMMSSEKFFTENSFNTFLMSNTKSII